MLSRRRFLLSGSAALCIRAAAVPLFEEVPAAVSGIDWIHNNALSDARYMPEAFGPGCAFLDYDNDGWMDIYLVNSGPSDFWKPSKPVRNALYRNNRDGTFSDVTSKAGVAGGNFGMGVAVGDYNNDGYPDMLVTGVGRAILYRNNGDGTFSDVTSKAGLDIPAWSTSAVWFDYDNDGKLDLFVGCYGDYGPAARKPCFNPQFLRNYFCDPRTLKSVPSLLFHNNGDGTFTEVGRATEIGRSVGKALGVVATDIDRDGRMDLFVSNDTAQNHLFMNRSPWEEIGLASGVGFSDSGQARSGMGVDAADIDGDGWEDLFVANIDQEMFSLYRNNRDETFTDVAPRHGLSDATRQLSGWGVRFCDYDNDGLLDLILANGHPDDLVDQYARGVHYQEPLLLFHQEGGKLRNVSAEAGPAFSRNLSARGLATGDFNNDGCLDLLIGTNGGAPVLLRNNAGRQNNWLGLHLKGTAANPDAIGARISWSARGVVRRRLKIGGGSYLSSHDPREILGIGSIARPDWVEVKWPGPKGRTERFTDLPVGKYTAIKEKS